MPTLFQRHCVAAGIRSTRAAQRPWNRRRDLGLMLLLFVLVPVTGSADPTAAKTTPAVSDQPDSPAEIIKRSKGVSDLLKVYDTDDRYAVRLEAKRALATKGKAFQRRVIEWIQKGDKSKYDPNSRLALAVSIARDMGDDAGPVVPHLLELAGTPYQDAALYSVIQIGAPSVEPMMEVLETNGIAHEALFQLGNVATPSLLKVLEEPSSERAKIIVFRTLNCSGPSADSAFSVFVKLLADKSKSNEKIRRGCIRSLGFLWFDKEDPIPILTKIANDANDPLRHEAASQILTVRAH